MVIASLKVGYKYKNTKWVYPFWGYKIPNLSPQCEYICDREGNFILIENVIAGRITVQEGWLSPTERASVSAISLKHILASHGYASGTIAVNVTWVEREFNAGQTHRSMCPSLFNPLRAIARYWSEIATFSYPLAFNAPIWVFPLESRGKFGPEKTNIMGLPGSEDRLTIGWAVSTQYLNMYDWRTLKT